jgi:hypothetical protein
MEKKKKSGPTLFTNDKYMYLFNSLASARRGYIVLRANDKNRKSMSNMDYLKHSIKHLKNILKTEDVSYMDPGTPFKCLAIRETAGEQYWQILASGKFGWVFSDKPTTFKKV